MCHVNMAITKDRLNEYGLIPTKSKGGFHIKSDDAKLKVIRRRDTSPDWDAKADKAVELIDSFLRDTIKKKDITIYEILMGYIQKNAAGELDYSKVMILLSKEDSYTDARWKEGLRLIKESFSLSFKAYNYQFEELNEKSGGYDRLQINFSQI